MELTKQLETLDEKYDDEALCEEVLSDLRSLIIWHDNNIEVAWRFARACVKNASDLSDQAQIEILAQEGNKQANNS